MSFVKLVVLSLLQGEFHVADFIQFRICLLTVRSNSHHIFGILRETLITLLGIFGSGSSSFRPHVRSSLLYPRLAKIYAIFQFFSLSVYGYVGFLRPFYLFYSRYISVFSVLSSFLFNLRLQLVHSTLLPRCQSLCSIYSRFFLCAKGIPPQYSQAHESITRYLQTFSTALPSDFPSSFPFSSPLPALVHCYWPSSSLIFSVHQ